ncbi:MAG: pantoate--beta-alanine ligase [Bacteroidota bacterium]
MKVINKTSDLQAIIEQLKNDGKSIGLVPTMGALHKGHLSLVKNSISNNDITVVSIFVNPTQFNNPNDLASYPRTVEKDLELLQTVGCDVVFAPEADDIYSKSETDSRFEFDFEGLDKVMEGKFRPGHFNGVVQIVSKLFDLVRPDRAYFGEKDFQQLAIIRLMTRRYNLPIEIVPCPIVREDSGLALSSRNSLLKDNEKQVAQHIYAVLNESRQFVPQTEVEELKQCVIAAIEQKPELKVEYFDIVDGHTLKSIGKWDECDYVVGCITVFCGNVRLIDNICYKK